MIGRVAYLEAHVLSADPLELICLLYQHAIDQVRDARRHLAGGAIAERCQAISKAIAVIGELNSSLDHAAGGAISGNLEQLYAYMTVRLTEANLHKDEGPLKEVESLLGKLAEGWKESRAKQSAEAQPQAPLGAEAWQGSSETSTAHMWSA